ncbi:hypothetical protein BST81_02520 [Leptolyngbya sp. 'hensonii']|nr:hypothetical protein BST81_02520 [Leptolyngbya sp. 'hensonii']
MSHPEIGTFKQDTVQVVETSILAVTAYVNQALIIRRGVVILTGLERELVIPGLSPCLRSESLQVSGIGTVGVRLLGIRTEPLQTTPPIVSEITDLNDRIALLEEQQRHIRNRLDSLQLQREFIQGLSEKSVDQFSQGLAQRQIDLEQTRQLVDFLGQQYREFTTVISQLEQEQQDLEQQLQKLRQQLAQIEATPGQGGHRLVVMVEPSGAGEFVLELSYVVDRAGWTPLYDMTFNRTGRQVKVSYLAEVKQYSGENWAGASLTLSTSELGTGALWPQFHPWYIDVSPPESSPYRHPGQNPAITSGDSSLRSETIPTEPIAVPPIVTKVARENGITTLLLGQEDGIPGDGTPRKVTILEDEYPCRIEYVALPRLASFAYLQAIVTNHPHGVTLLPGQANIFRNNLFIGTIRLEQVAPGQPFRLDLGIDEGLKIQRQLVECQTRRGIFLQSQVTTYAYRLTIANLRDREITLKVTEQLPLSRSEQVTTRLLRALPAPTSSSPQALEWTIVLPPEARRELSYCFAITYPLGLTLTGMESDR